MKVLMFVSILVLSGCNLLPKPAAVHDFGNTLTAANLENGANARPGAVTVEAPKWFYDNRIRYRMLYAAPTQVSFYTLDRWLAPPPELFEHLLDNYGAQWPAPVTVNLNVFEQQFTAPGKAQALLQFTATQYSADNKQPVSKRDFTFKQACPSADAKGAVAAFSVLVKQAAQELLAWTNATNNR
jgi:cholesterol transport system auxiliary component